MLRWADSCRGGRGGGLLSCKEAGLFSVLSMFERCGERGKSCIYHLYPFLFKYSHIRGEGLHMESSKAVGNRWAHSVLKEKEACSVSR